MGKFSRPLSASLSADDRIAQRYKLRLETSSRSTLGETRVLIHDMSEIGLSLETETKLAIGETIQVDLPFIGARESQVIWQEDNRFGCEFLDPVTSGDLSAALLRSGNPANDEDNGGTVEEEAIGIKPSLDEITEWKVAFERSRASLGYRLVGFRQTPEGVLIAIINKTS